MVAKITQEEFLSRATATHGDKYDYSMAEYQNADEKVKILCKEHNAFFEMQAFNHFYGQGCPRCAQYGFRRTRPASLYIYRITNGMASFTGYGITNDTYRRTKQHNLSLSKTDFKITETEVIRGSGEDILNLETALCRCLESSPLAENICGFKRESTNQSFDSVVILAKEIFKEKQWQHLT